jgi:CHAT domain-containing protein
MNEINDLLNNYNTQINNYQININEILNNYNNQINNYQMNINELILLLRPTSDPDSSTRSETQIRLPRRDTTTQNSTFLTDQTFNTTTINTGTRIYRPRNLYQQQLTQVQINNSTIIIPYSTDLSETRCPISLNDFIIGENVCQIKYCSHIFNPVDIYRWLCRNNVCPVCRYDIRTYDVSQNIIDENIEIVDEEENQNYRQIFHNRRRRLGQRDLDNTLIDIFRMYLSPLDISTLELNYTSSQDVSNNIA